MKTAKVFTFSLFPHIIEVQFVGSVAARRADRQYAAVGVWGLGGADCKTGLSQGGATGSQSTGV